MVLRAPNPNLYTGGQWQGPGPLALQEKNFHKDGSSETNKAFIIRKKSTVIALKYQKKKTYQYKIYS